MQANDLQTTKVTGKEATGKQETKMLVSSAM
jgi:hypothetical protein